ncbi:hypothetical protein GHT07_17885 [Caenimonas koreensis DSM 17982]|uniref:Calx-beta domain-containing protein n=1 Tax=Caenimonas koreensis DSM 17982 TaxID=1121255 RepID=A0A844AX87_9BURK|nr:Calx-beta domain-containing protein [Caenimonas koreensis]MRD49150.1 hypothetical protein [Caenimonas koreensis DSM 17982]
MPTNTSPTFRSITGGGVTLPGNGGFNSFGTNVFVLGDGRILVTGTRDNGGNLSSAGGPNQDARDFLLARFLADGSVDTSFGNQGSVTTAFGLTAQYRSAALQADGKILIVGGAWKSPGNNFQFAIARYNADGSLDTTFDGDGKVTTIVTTRSDVLYSVVALPTGKVLVAGFSTTTANGSGSFRDFTLARYNADGSLDATFNGDGNSDGLIVTPVSSNSFDAARSIIVLSSGKILAAGVVADATGTLFNPALVRYNADGSLDTGFGTGGKVVLSTNPGDSSAQDNWSQVQEDSNGKLLLMGQVASGLQNGSTRIELVRLNADGTPDTSFNGDGNADGRIMTPVGDVLDVVYRVMNLPDGKILVSGLSFYNATSNYGILIRYNHDGSLDTTFGGDGIVYSPWPVPADASFQDIAVQGDGKIVVTGFRGALISGSYDIAVLRYNTNGTLDTSFGSMAQENIVGYNIGAPAGVLAPDASVFDAELAGLNSGQGDYGGASLTLVRHGGVNSADHFGASGALSMTATSASAGTLALHGTPIGTYASTGSGWKITLAAGTTQARLDEMLPLLTYSNSNPAVTGTLQIDMIFSDGNSGSQGTGGAGVTTSSAFVVTAPAVVIHIDGELAQEGLPTQVRVFLSGPSSGVVTVHWSTSDVTATAGSDYTAQANQVLTFQPGETEKFITITPTADGVAEGPEFLLINLFGATGATVADGEEQAPVLIAQSGVPPVATPSITVANVAAFEGHGDTSFFLMLDAPSTQTVSVHYATATGTAGAADFGAVSGTAVFAPGETFKVIDVHYVEDGIAESTESFSMQLSSPLHATIATPIATGTILDNDPGGASGGLINGTNGADVLIGTEAPDTINGGDGNDVLFSNDGADVMNGGDGDDVYVGVQQGAVINEAASQGNDTVIQGAIASYTLPANVENLVMLKDALNGTGNGLDNRITGDALSNTILGLAGNDTLTGGGGNDTLDGGQGNDVAVFPGAFSLYSIAVDNATGDLFVTGPAGVTRLHAVELLQFDDRSFSVQQGTVAPEFLGGGEADDLIRGRDGNDTVEGGGGDDALYGDEGTDSLLGDSGDDLLDGGTGADSMTGGTGDDTYIVDSAGDVVTESESAALTRPKDPTTLNPGGGIDTVVASINYTLGSFIENLVLAQGASPLAGTGNALANQLTGNDGNNTLSGGLGDDRIEGGGGIDTAVFAYPQNQYSRVSGDGYILLSAHDEGRDTLTGVERVEYADSHFAIDLDGNAMLALRLVATLFSGNAFVAHLDTVGKYLAMFDAGLSMQDVAQAAVRSQEFADLAGSHTNEAFVNQVFANLFFTLPPPDLKAQLVGWLDTGVFTQASLAALAADLPQALDAAGYNNMTTFGVEYVPQNVPVHVGGAGHDSLSGSAGDDFLYGEAGNDTLVGAGGGDLLVGGEGADMAVFNGLRSSFDITRTLQGFTVVPHGASPDGDQVNTLISVERERFTDVTLAFDLDGNAGTAAKVVGAMFGAGALANQQLVGQYLSLLDNGASYEDAIGAAAASERFAQLAGSHSNEDFVDQVFFNLVGFLPPPDLKAQYISILETPGYSQAYLGMLAADTFYNLDNVNLTGLAATGLAYSA